MITAAGDLPARWVVHAVGPRWEGGDQDEEALLGGAYPSAMRLAAQAGARTVALPAISAGIYGYPLPAAAAIGLDAVRDHLAGHHDGRAGDLRPLFGGHARGCSRRPWTAWPPDRRRAGRRRRRRRPHQLQLMARLSRASPPGPRSLHRGPGSVHQAAAAGLLVASGARCRLRLAPDANIRAIGSDVPAILAPGARSVLPRRDAARSLHRVQEPTGSVGQSVGRDPMLAWGASGPGHRGAATPLRTRTARAALGGPVEVS